MNYSKNYIQTIFIFITLSLFTLAGCMSSKTYSTRAPHKSVYQSGKASWYGEKYHGRKTASGEKYNMNDMTAAHKKLPFGTKVKVTSKINGQSVIVRINDRGPFAKNRIIDVSKAAAKKLGMIQKGEIPVTLNVL